MTDFSSFPYRSFSEIRIRNNEPLSYSFLNSHIVRLCSNMESLGVTNTLQKATYEQWGTAKLAKPSDIIDYENGAKTGVLTNSVINEAIEKLRYDNAESLFRDGVLNLSKNYEFHTGEFLVGKCEKRAFKITSAPSRVVFTRLDVHPVGFDKKPFYLTRKTTTSKSSFSKSIMTAGVINFIDWNKPEEYNEFHVYYHNKGYVICENGIIDDNQTQIRVVWTQLMRK